CPGPPLIPLSVSSLASSTGRSVRKPRAAGNVIECDQTGTALVGQIGPGPLKHDEDAVAEADEVEDVDAGPDKPGRQTSELEAPDLADGISTADGGKSAFVKVVKGRGRRLVADAGADDAGSVVTLLKGDGRDARKRFAVL